MAALSASPITLWVRQEVDVVRVRRQAARLGQLVDLLPPARARLDLVVAELAMNAVRHAGGGRIVLRVGTDPPALHIDCEDTGPGLGEAPGARRGLGLGLAVVAELADALTLTSEPGRGTRVQAQVWFQSR